MFYNGIKLFKGLTVTDKENNIYTIYECEDVHNILLTDHSREDKSIIDVWCLDKHCGDYDGELTPDIKYVRKLKLQKLNEKF